MISRRRVLKKTTEAGASPALPPHPGTNSGDDVEVNDVQSQLNATRVHRILKPTSIEEIQTALKAAERENRCVSICGGRHAMGGQQFGAAMILLDTIAFNKVVRFDKAQGIIDVEAGIHWPELIAYLNREQEGLLNQWTIREKQTGVDRVSLGGSLGSNIHGRGLRHPPIIGDVESFDLIDASGKLVPCSRRDNSELFALAIGGYGLFGVIARVRLRLVPRTKVERIVEIIHIKDLLPGVEQRLRQGFVYGDCQYSTDLSSQAEFHQGVFSCYRPVPLETSIPSTQKTLSGNDWAELYTLARSNKKEAFKRYFDYYLSTSGQVYWSDTHQLAGNFTGYSAAVEIGKSSEMITEVYVSKENFLPLMAEVRKDALARKMDITYGTIRFVEKDSESFLAWARESSVCIVCNLHVIHTDAGRKKAAEDFQSIIDRAIQFGGRYYLTYHRWATRRQVETCYPQFAEFLSLKKKYDPGQRFQSDWYRHYRTMFEDKL